LAYDEDFWALVASVKARGVLEPLLASSDDVVIAGHRRLVAAVQAGLETVPVIREAVSYEDDRGAFLRLLVEANSQRKKTPAMLIREAAILVDPEEAIEEIVEDRREKRERERFAGELLIGNNKKRKRISAGKVPMLNAAIAIINANEDFWPLSVRQIHYRLLGSGAPLRHASKPDSGYVNNRASYNDLTDLLARGRIEGFIPWAAIDDETRAVMTNNHYRNAGAFVAGELKWFLKGYVRNRQQSQPHHIELIAEKLTLKTFLDGIAERHSIPLTINRGMSGPTVKKKVEERFILSGKDKLILLVVTDLDPGGDTIAQDIRNAFERDFDIRVDQLEVYKVALTYDQVIERGLPPSMDAKTTSPTYESYVAKYGTTAAVELEALEPAALQEIVVGAIESVMDMDAYAEELRREREDARTIVATKRQVLNFMRGAG
jgi:hypothetical protein